MIGKLTRSPFVTDVSNWHDSSYRLFKKVMAAYAKIDGVALYLAPVSAFFTDVEWNYVMELDPFSRAAATASPAAFSHVGISSCLSSPARFCASIDCQPLS